ncbi:PAB-dependent poly(A)-specific ribonuclease subunit 3 [Coemansia sp. RSA 1807]|nr:PAB-dependent poly(A)-specific ribonuclease subunit 3 [Coemansia sp. RSA 532]KAJ2275853.1 PAB-dependent poly(A)-specific ribonuclease subunit 3 [Coemansia sp. RSA 370]KAJ2576595.1 PAB-dependent poly(A)-specific ribonuclease subunit 3 [Coemansia sp. RSA 1807]
MADNVREELKAPPRSSTPTNKPCSPVPRLQTPVKLRASSPAFQPFPSKGRPAVAGNSQLRDAPAFTPRKRQQQQQQQELATSPTMQTSKMVSDLSLVSIDSKGAASTTKDDSGDDYFMKLPQSNSQTPHMQSVGYFAIDENLRRALAREMHTTYSVDDSELPFQVHNYYSLSPLETVEAYTPGSVKQQAIKAQSISDGRHYTLNRIAGLQSGQKPELGVIDQWRQVQNPNVAHVHEAFITHAFGDNSLVVVHDYKPLAASLVSKIAENQVPASEGFLWSIVLQLTSALSAIHAAGLAVHMLDAATVLLSPTNRVYIGSGGLADVLSMQISPSIEVAQQSDLRSIGQILRVLLNRNPENVVAVQGQPPMVMPGLAYSAEFKELFRYLNHHVTPVITVEDILRLAGSRVLAELDAARRETDLLLDNLRLEMANGRLVRLLCKMNFITEREDSAGDSKWSETGDRYLVKLFRDYVFHMVDESSRPVANMAHVVGNLNRLDAGSPEKVMLMSRDEKSCLVVSYSEVKRCIEGAYQELVPSAQAWK